MTPVKVAIVDQSVMTTDSQTSVTTAVNSAGKSVFTCLDFSAAQWLTTDAQKGRSHAVFFWKRQEIKGVGGTDPKDSVFYRKKNIELGGGKKNHPRGGDKVLTHWNVGHVSVTYLWIL